MFVRTRSLSRPSRRIYLLQSALSDCLVAACISPEGRLLESLCYLFCRGEEFYAGVALGCMGAVVLAVQHLHNAVCWSMSVLSSEVRDNSDGDDPERGGVSPPAFTQGAFVARCRDVGLTAAMTAALARHPTLHQAGVSKLFESLEELGLKAAEPARCALPPLPPRAPCSVSDFNVAPGARTLPAARTTPPAAQSSSPLLPAVQLPAGVPPRCCGKCEREPTAGEPSFKLCSGCRAVRFCGEACLRAAWKAGHKAECRAAAAAAELAAAAGDAGGGGSNRRAGKAKKGGSSSAPAGGSVVLKAKAAAGAAKSGMGAAPGAKPKQKK